MSRLVAFGCSNTYGHGLRDCFIPPTGQGIRPSSLAWPSVLATTIGRKCVNRAECGISNKEIWHRFLQTDLNATDVVVLSWTYSSRWCVINCRNEVGDRLVCNDSQKKSKMFFKYLFNELDMDLDTNLRMHHVHLLLKEKGIKNFHFVNNHDEFMRAPWNDAHLLRTTLDHGRDYLPVALDGQHPGEAAHKRLAELIYNEIKGQI